MTHKHLNLFFATLAIGIIFSNCNAQEQRDFYVTVDGRNPLTFGTYTGLDNPNIGRLTLLFAHWNEETPENNHFHSIGSYNYEGPVESPSVTTTNTNNRIPEYFTGQDPLTLQEGTGAFAGKLVSGRTGEHYSDLTFHSIHELQSAIDDSPESVMYGSSGGGYANTTMKDMNLAIELVSMTPGLFLGTEQLSSPGDRLMIGSESELPYQPVFWTEDNATRGHYAAEFKLVDISGNYPDSGTINFDFAVVPEPISNFPLLICLLVTGATLHRRKH